MLFLCLKEAGCSVDVYKRQTKFNWEDAKQRTQKGTLQNALWQGMEQLRQMRVDPCFAPDAWVTTWDSHNPVSYTHLDVYKRQIMGYTAANLLMTRIEEPSLNYRTVYTETNLILRESTGD